MDSLPRIAVVGAGIAGASCAFFLADRGARVTLIERQHPASGPTGKSSSLLHVFYMMPELSQLAARGNLVADPDIYNEGAEAEESAAIVEFFQARIPAIENLGIRPGYSGLYDMSPDDNPVIDAVPGVDGLFTIRGSSGHGFKMGAAVGEAAAQMALGEKPAVLAPFTIGRLP